MWALTVLGYILLILLVILLLLLIVPVKYSFTGEKYESAFIKGKVSLLLGFVKLYYYNDFEKKNIAKITLLGFPVNISYKKKRKKKRRPKKDKSYNYLNKRFLKSSLKTIGKVILHIKPSKLEISGKIGFDDPYYTGLICAFRNIFYPKFKNAKINIDTVFEDEIFEGSFLIQGRVILFYVVYMVLRLYFLAPDKIKHKKMKFKEVANYDTKI
ncbi:MAG TPA: DUF2953 domain-containing protein [Ruminiclostridium sp.]|jgi:hypothetical protein|uniref:DUF2953 domain-containing protein n=1 Tax=Acetivibrio saccincola TaxID=1677857 RepID=A0A2K9E466_9FIRM|nr:DUF2953 domain-containing protein [Acetivibrio saccincola]HAA42555.1 DUF2953 domain-containing protein [Ruminiclostridium sp.]AUG58179.1 hypothetical protein HVS_11435 [Acetivibrio saccincola]NLW26697.1 DUF2953 domain-containing protein [Acetivibrio saccincola]HOA96451.1 DUF2953 domain-containing protein [Acetivibrio saccincola]HQD27685.1 DUF2953 domain-containing protein [Acetivibrio saccincola]